MGCNISVSNPSCCPLSRGRVFEQRQLRPGVTENAASRADVTIDEGGSGQMQGREFGRKLREKV